MSVAGFETKLVAAQTAVESSFQQVFKGDSLTNQYSAITSEIQTDSLKNEIVLLDHLGTVKEWVGEKQFEDARAYSRTETMKFYYKTLALKRSELQYNSSGTVAAMAANFASDAATMLDKLVIDKLSANPTCYDGVSLVSASHPNGAGGATWSNSSSNALSESELRSAIIAMQKFQRENGEYYGINPTHLMVGPDLQHLAKELVGDTRPVGVTAAGVWPATGSAVAAAGIQNVIGGSIQVIVSPRFDSNDWLLMDLSRGNLRPMSLFVGRKPELIHDGSMTAGDRYKRDLFTWSIEFDAVAAAGLPQLCFGRID